MNFIMNTLNVAKNFHQCGSFHFYEKFLTLKKIPVADLTMQIELARVNMSLFGDIDDC